MNDGSPGTTGYADNPCFPLPLKVLTLQNDLRDASRGIAGARRSDYRPRAEAIVAKARQYGCHDPVGLSGFLTS